MNEVSIKVRARNRWRGILPALGIDARFLINRHGPCPMCEGKDRFRFDDRDGEGTWICSKCGAGDGVKLVMLKLGLEFKDARIEIEKHVGAAPVETKPKGRTPEQKFETIRRTWNAAEPACLANPAGAYLFRRCGVAFALSPKVFRFSPRCAYREADGSTSFHPALLALVSDVAGNPVNIHRTYLAEDGSKSKLPEPKRTMEGTLPPGCAVRIGRPAEEMGVSTGIETSFSARRLFGVPVWATLNDNRLETWKPPEGVRLVRIFGDNDRSFSGQASAHILARRLVNERFEVEVHIPEVVGWDWNDQHVQAMRDAA